MEINYDKTLLVVIDMQTVTMKLAKKFAVHDAQAVLANNNRLIEASNGQMSVALLHGLPKFVPGSLAKRLTELATDLQLRQADNVASFTKHQPSAYTSAEFRAYLQVHEIETIILTGISTDDGVLKTAREMQSAGYHIITVTDATTTTNLKKYQTALTELMQIGKVTTTSELIKALVVAK
ncbi:isochorismatase family protein [Periweissella cryptocerci]|uniref:Isochorismatase family protein n=1 Tax=Periweissella cryptocerci TaxID=2506420 RepID=A0A4V1AIH8_9LACO|nr:isochorismatase family protein [Periweissella cryptocerci]QBO35555.1 isochorismatase family protein [Periweissella cryptocerci]